MADYAQILRDREKKKLDPVSNPIGTIYEAGKAFFGSEPVKEAATDAGKYAQILASRIPDPIKRGGKIVGSHFMDAISWLDKFRGAAAGGLDIAGQFGPKLTRDDSTGEYSILDQNQTVMSSACT